MTDNVVKIADLQFSRKAWSSKECLHRNISLDRNGGVVKCLDCNESLSAFWALSELVTRYEATLLYLENAKKEVSELQEKNLSLKAAKIVEQAWRSKTMVPTCPHCTKAIFPTDGFGLSLANKEFEVYKRRKNT